MPEVHDVLANYPPDCQLAHIEPLGSAGGMSGAQFWRITAPSVLRGSPDPALPRTLILRRWPAEHPSPERLRLIHAVLCHAATGVDFLPIPVTTNDGQSFIQHGGHVWELAPWMPGSADYERSPRIEKLRAAMTALARFHLVVADFPRSAAPDSAGGSNAVTRHLARLHDLTRGQINELSRAISESTWPELSPLARQFVAALPQVVPPAIAQLEPLANVGFPLQPCLRDIWHDHVLFTGDEVTGLIDFGAVDIDTPATDIARLLGSFAGAGTVPFSSARTTDTAMPLSSARPQVAKRGLSPSAPDEAQTWREGLDAYASVRPLFSDETRAAYALNTSGNVLAGCNWIRWICIEHRQFENRAQVIERFHRIVARCTRSHSPRSGGSA